MTMSWYLMTKTKNNKKQLSTLKKNFEKADKDRDGEISMEDWILALKKANFEFSRKDVEAIFKEKDKDHNGKLSWQEFCGEKTPTEKAFGIMDVDNNGKVSKEVTVTKL